MPPRPDVGAKWLEDHLSWQRDLFRRDPASARFLLLRPGDRFTVCDLKGQAADVRKACWRAAAPAVTPNRGEHWDEYMLRGMSSISRPVPGLGNVMLSLVSAALAAAVSQRVLLVENYTVAQVSFGEPFPELMYESSTWRPYVEAEQRAGRAVDWWAAHDSREGFERLCADNLRINPPARVLRIFSNFYFAPLLMHNAHHRAEIDGLAAPPLLPPERFPRAAAAHDGAPYSTGLWPRALATLLRPRAHLRSKVRAFREANFPREGMVLGMHIRSAMTHEEHEQSVECARRAMSATNATAVLLVSMHGRELQRLSAQLSPVVKVLRTPPAPPAQGADASHFEAAVLDMLYLASTDGLLLSRGSTFGYVAAGLARRPATIFSRSPVVQMSKAGKVGTCEVVPSTEPVFHQLSAAVLTMPSCLAASRAPPSTLLRLSSLSY
jgi:hypothetical protein